VGITTRLPLLFLSSFLTAFLAGCASTTPGSHGQPGKQQSLKEWQQLTEHSAVPPRVFVDHNQIRFYFWPKTNEVVQFKAVLTKQRWPYDEYEVNSGPLVLEAKPSPIPRPGRPWREARLIRGEEWRLLMTNLIGVLTPPKPGHGAYYRGILGGRFLYRDNDGTPRFAPVNEPPKDITIDHRYSIEETLQILARNAEKRLAHTHPNDSVFVLMAPNIRHFPQPLLIDRARRRCIWLSPVDFYHSSEPGHAMTYSSRSINALVLQGHGVALIKNPVSSAGRLVNLLTQTLVSFLRLPVPGPARNTAPLSHDPGMDLVQWESWLDRHTSTHQQDGSLKLLIDGERFFPRLQKAILQASNHIHFEQYIFDNDDVAVEIADQLKQKSHTIPTDIILDCLGSISASQVPPSTPPLTNFIPPVSITAYLKQDSRIRVRPFLNPFASYDHAKVYLIDGRFAWLGGMNIGREYRYEWHDLMVELQGPVVDSLENQFRRHWAHEGPYGDLGYLAAWFHPKQKPAVPCNNQPWSRVRLLPTRTLWKPFSTAVLGAIDHARSYIYVENPYLFDKRILRALARARGRGVDVRAIVPRANDSKAGRRAELVISNYLLDHGVQVYVYPGMTHVKALLVDGWACLGSGNLNQFGLAICQEQNVATSDPAFAAQVKHELFDADFEHAYEVTHQVSVGWLDSAADIVVEGL
jgi:phosphatidylserine/phosphatidylglycerophosphate/cardiolipin synthase-like enzyme